MPEKLESKVRKLDDESKSITESVKDVAEQLGANPDTVYKYIFAKRKGFKTFGKYDLALARKKGTTKSKIAKIFFNKKFGNTRWAMDFYAAQRGFESQREYLNSLAQKNTALKTLNN